MKLTAVILSFISSCCFAAAVAGISLKKAGISKMRGEELGLLKTAGSVAGYFYSAILKLNSGLTGFKRYNKIVFFLKKTGMDTAAGIEKFILFEETSAAAGFLVWYILSGSILQAVAAGSVFFFIPVLILKSKVRELEKKIMKEIPDAMDIIAAGIEGGFSLPKSAENYTTRNKNIFSAVLSDAFDRARLGLGLKEALKETAERLDMSEVTGFMNAFIQAEKSGGNVKNIIKALAAEMRKKQFMYLRKRAHEAPVKLLIPLIIFIFPVTFIFLFGPVVIRLFSGM